MKDCPELPNRFFSDGQDIPDSMVKYSEQNSIENINQARVDSGHRW